MSGIREELSAAVRQALDAIGVDSSVDPAIERSARPEFGDWSSAAAMRSAKLLKTAPLGIAEKLRDALEAQALELVVEWTVTPPGYLNARLNDQAWVSRILSDANALEVSTPLTNSNSSPGRTLVEHTATNPNKAAHVGHLRNACIGDSVSRILRRTGQEVEVQNYIDDTGVQVADVVVGVRELGIAQNDGEPFDQYCSRVYVEVGRRYESEPDLVERRRATLHDIEAGDNETANFVKELTTKIVDCHLATMARFDIEYDLLAWESDILHLGFWQTAFDQLRDSGAITKFAEGKLAGCWVMPDDEDDDDGKVFVKSDGVATYTAKDTAYQLWKFGLLGKDFRYHPWKDGSALITTATSHGDDGGGRFGKAQRVVNVIDSRQAYPQSIVKKALARLGHVKEAENSIHLGYEFVALSKNAAEELGLEVEPGKEIYAFSGRKGIDVRADDLLDKAIERISAKAQNQSVVAPVAAGAIRYYLLRFGLNQVIAFDFDEALRTTGDTGIYVQYAHARASGILRKVADDGEAYEIPALEPSERALVHQLDAYRYELVEAAQTMSPHLLCTYVYNLASALSDFYEHTDPIVREENGNVRRFRRALVAATRKTLGDALTTLGLAAPDHI